MERVLALVGQIARVAWLRAQSHFPAVCRPNKQQQVLEQQPFDAVKGLNCVDGVRTEQIAMARGSLCRKASQARPLSILRLALHELHRQRARVRAHACV